MRYIITGKNTVSGTKGNDSADLAIYFELGWEVVGSRLDAIKLLKTGALSNDDTTIVTVNDRKFMYSAIFNNVISWEEFLGRVNLRNIKMFDTVEDWTQTRQFSFLNPNGDFEFWENRDASVLANSKYSRYEQDYNEIVDGFEKNGAILEELEEDESYYVACLRFRDHCEFRSSPMMWWNQLLDRMIEETGKKIFLVGAGAENFVKSNKVKHVPRLQDYVTLIQDSRCKAVIAQSTGTLVLALTATKAPLHWVDHANVSFINENNAVMGGTCARFLQTDLYRYGADDINLDGIDKIMSRVR
jgi:hypothetical protein